MEKEREEELSQPMGIGVGSFAKVYDYRHHAFKVVHDIDNNEALMKEYEVLEILRERCGRQLPCFRLPMAMACYNPQKHELGRLFGRSSGEDNLKLNFAVFRHLCPGRAIYCMERLKPLPYHIACDIRYRFYHEHFRSTMPVPAICRPYFGRKHMYSSSRFFSERNYPLDRTRYETLAAARVLPRIEFIAEAMGHMLATLHWKGHNDARDVEFVLASHPNSLGVAFYVIDFNQTQRFEPSLFRSTSAARDSPDGPVNDTPEALMDRVLVQPFFDNDPYYPRPRRSDPLYKRFKEGYLDGAGEVNCLRANSFLKRIERFQREKDIRREGTSKDVGRSGGWTDNTFGV